jgi:hypothetical protein
MTKLGWTDVVFGATTARELAAINSAAEGVEALQVADAGLAQQIGKLYRLDVAQGEEIRRLRMTVEVLIDVLVDTVGLDPSVLKYRLEAALEEARAADEETERRGAMVRCAACAAEVPSRSTTITEIGVVCDPCAANSRP